MAVLTSEYQYIGRSAPVGCAAGWNYYVLLYAKTAGDTAGGKHTVTVRARLACTSDATFYGYGTTFSLTVGGIPAGSWEGAPIPAADWSQSAPITEGGIYYYRRTDLAEYTAVVDTGWGSAADIPIAVSFGRVQSVEPVPRWLPYYKTYAAGTLTVTLPALAGAAVIEQAEDRALGENCSIRWTPLPGLYYRLGFSMGAWRGTTDVLAPDASPFTYTGFLLPMEAAHQLPNSKTGSMEVSLTTYTDPGGTQSIGGVSTARFTVTVSAPPEVAFASLTPVSALPAPLDGLFLKGLSRLRAELSAAGQYGATILSAVCTVEGKTFTEVSDFLTTTGEVTVRATVTDSRGETAACTGTVYVHDYAAPTLQAGQCARCDENGNLTDSGTRLRVQVSGTCFPVGGCNTTRLWYRWKRAGDTAFSDPVALCDGVSFDGLLPHPALDPQTSYTLCLGITDTALQSASVTCTVLTEKIYWHRGSDFLALGMYTQHGGLECGWPARFYGDVFIGDVPLKTYIQNLITGG